MQTWKTKDLPEKWKSTQTSIKKFMPSWEYVLMTDETNREFILKYFPNFLETYDSFKYNIQRADAIRYAWLYINGGLYIDCDFELLAPLDEIFEEDSDLYFLASSNISLCITNQLIAAKPGNNIFLEMIEEMKKKRFFSHIDRHLLVMNTTGPMAFTRVIKRSGIKYNKLPIEKLNPYTLCDKIYDNPNALLKPLEGSSWVGITGTAYKWCYCNTDIIFGVVGFLIIIILALFVLLLHDFV